VSLPSEPFLKLGQRRSPGFSTCGFNICFRAPSRPLPALRHGALPLRQPQVRRAGLSVADQPRIRLHVHHHRAEPQRRLPRRTPAGLPSRARARPDHPIRMAAARCLCRKDGRTTLSPATLSSSLSSSGIRPPVHALAAQRQAHAARHVDQWDVRRRRPDRAERDHRGASARGAARLGPARPRLLHAPPRPRPSRPPPTRRPIRSCTRVRS
jgi:hypothetical protein